MTVFNKILDLHAPNNQIKYSKQQNKRNAKPWITPDILKIIKLKDKTLLKYQLKETYKEQKNEITNMIRKSKKIYFNEYFAKNSSNDEKTLSRYRN